MQRLVFSMGLFVLMAGCQGARSPYNPLGTPPPAQIPPPGTGSAGRPDPFFNRSMSSLPASMGAVPGGTAQTPQKVYTSNASSTGSPQMVDQRVYRQPLPGVPSSAAPPPLDWRPPDAIPAGVAPTAVASGRAVPRPRFPASTSPTQTRVPLPNAPLMTEGPAIDEAYPVDVATGARDTAEY